MKRRRASIYSQPEIATSSDPDQALTLTLFAESGQLKVVCTAQLSAACAGTLIRSLREALRRARKRSLERFDQAIFNGEANL